MGSIQEIVDHLDKADEAIRGRVKEVRDQMGSGGMERKALLQARRPLQEAITILLDAER